MKKIFYILPFLFIGCSSKKATVTSEEAREKLKTKWSEKLGKVRKVDLVEYFGRAEWCRPEETGEETCRFYRKKATQWVGDNKKDKKSYESYEEVIASFDKQGVLKAIEAEAQM